MSLTLVKASVIVATPNCRCAIGIVGPAKAVTWVLKVLLKLDQLVCRLLKVLAAPLEAVVVLLSVPRKKPSSGALGAPSCSTVRRRSIDSARAPIVESTKMITENTTRRSNSAMASWTSLSWPWS